MNILAAFRLEIICTTPSTHRLDYRLSLFHLVILQDLPLSFQVGFNKRSFHVDDLSRYTVFYATRLFFYRLKEIQIQLRLVNSCVLLIKLNFLYYLFCY